MRIFEYQGKELFKKYGIPLPQGRIIDENRELKKVFPDIDKGNGVVLKAQVLTGGRGKRKGSGLQDPLRNAKVNMMNSST